MAKKSQEAFQSQFPDKVSMLAVVHVDSAKQAKNNVRIAIEE